MLPLIRDRRRIGVLGVNYAGKTTFMTSLINHLKQHDGNDFALQGGAVALKYSGPLPAEDGTPEFEYKVFREQLHNRVWPAKTSAVSEFRCELSLQGGDLMTRMRGAASVIDLSLVDIPGERLADLTMAKRSYQEWSEAILQQYESKFDYLVECREYLNLVEGAVPSAPTEIVAAYKNALAKLVFKQMPLITPSTIALAEDGSYVPKKVRRTRDAAALAAVHFVGLNAAHEFAPLPAEAIEENPAAASLFEEHYEVYREFIVKPLWNKFFACDHLAILVDIANILANGVTAFNGTLHVIKSALQCLSPSPAPIDWLKVLTGGHVDMVKAGLSTQPRVSRIAFVATQADRVHADDQDKLLPLLKELVDPALEGHLERLDIKYFACSAVKASASKEYPKIEVVPFDGNGRPEPEFRDVAVSSVPDRWPAKWDPDTFFFPKFAPPPPDLYGVPMAHIGLNRVAEFLLNL